MPETEGDFHVLVPGKLVDVWMPAALYPHPEAFTRWGWLWFRIMGRLAPNTTREQIATRLQPVFHEFQEKRVATVPTMPESIRHQFLQGLIRVNPGTTGISDFRRTFERPMWMSGRYPLAYC